MYSTLTPFLQSYGQSDKAWLKYYVFVAWILDTIHEGLLLNGIYFYLVKDIGNLPALAQALE